MNKMIEIKWSGRGKRILGPAEGYSQTYVWDGHGAVVAVPQKDALRVLTEPRAQFTCVNPADLSSLEAGGAEPPQATARGRIVLKVAAVAADTELDEDRMVEPEPATPKPPARKGRKPSGTGTKPKKTNADA